jgi:type II secretory pathway component PulK
MYTIKQIADELGVSKEAVRKRLPSIPPTSLTTGKRNAIMVDETGKLLLQALVSGNGESQLPTDNRTDYQPNRQPEAVKTVPWEVYEDLRKQLEVKDEQIKSLSDALLAAQQSAQAAQALHAGTMQTKLLDEPKKGFFRNLFGRK